MADGEEGAAQMSPRRRFREHAQAAAEEEIPLAADEEDSNGATGTTHGRNTPSDDGKGTSVGSTAASAMSSETRSSFLYSIVIDAWFGTLEKVAPLFYSGTVSTEDGCDGKRGESMRPCDFYGTNRKEKRRNVTSQREEEDETY